jgi:hypothetical protein
MNCDAEGDAKAGSASGRAALTLHASEGPILSLPDMHPALFVVRNAGNGTFSLYNEACGRYLGIDAASGEAGGSPVDPDASDASTASQGGGCIGGGGAKKHSLPTADEHFSVVLGPPGTIALYFDTSERFLRVISDGEGAGSVETGPAEPTCDLPSKAVGKLFNIVDVGRRNDVRVSFKLSGFDLQSFEADENKKMKELAAMQEELSSSLCIGPGDVSIFVRARPIAATSSPGSAEGAEKALGDVTKDSGLDSLAGGGAVPAVAIQLEQRTSLTDVEVIADIVMPTKQAADRIQNQVAQLDSLGAEMGNALAKVESQEKAQHAAQVAEVINTQDLEQSQVPFGAKVASDVSADTRDNANATEGEPVIQVTVDEAVIEPEEPTPTTATTTITTSTTTTTTTEAEVFNGFVVISVPGQEGACGMPSADGTTRAEGIGSSSSNQSQCAAECRANPRCAGYSYMNDAPVVAKSNASLAERSSVASDARCFLSAQCSVPFYQAPGNDAASRQGFGTVYARRPRYCGWSTKPDSTTSKDCGLDADQGSGSPRANGSFELCLASCTQCEGCVGFELAVGDDSQVLCRMLGSISYAKGNSFKEARPDLSESGALAAWQAYINTRDPICAKAAKPDRQRCWLRCPRG